MPVEAKTSIEGIILDLKPKILHPHLRCLSWVIKKCLQLKHNISFLLI